MSTDYIYVLRMILTTPTAYLYSVNRFALVKVKDYVIYEVEAS
jgi:hypothetical protein